MFKTTRSSAAIILAAGLFAAGSAPGSEPAATKRLPVPAADAVAKSRGTIRAAYESDYKTAKQSGEYASLLEKLRSSATTETDPARKYAFLLEAEEVTTEHDDVAATLETVDRRAELFEVDGLDERAKTLARLATPKVTPDLALFEQARDTATRAAAAERFDIATNSAKLALDVARAIDRAQKAAARPRQYRRPTSGEAVPTANGGELIKSASETQARIIRHKKLFDEYQEAQTTLATTPDHAAANTKAGTYLCLVARRWDQGLPHLKKSGRATLGDLAAEELALGDLVSADAAKVFAIAGTWWETGDSNTLSEDEKDAVRDHASRLYAAVRPKLTDPLEIRVAHTRGTQDQQPVGGQQLLNSVGMKLTLIPAGVFRMGSSVETPAHEVQITKPFYLGVYEVTNAQWKTVMGSTPSAWKDDDRPVEQVTFDDVVAFCRKLSERPEERAAGRVYRPPTESEWEYASRAGTTTQFSFGNDAALLGIHGWFDGNAEGLTHPVGQKKPNPWGLFDMHGNVWEWCSDWHANYSGDALTDPQGPATGSYRILRGGGWQGPAANCRTAYRVWVVPSYHKSDLGFRVAMTLPATGTSVSGSTAKPSE